MPYFSVREAYHSPRGMRLGYIGDAREHANRLGTTHDQYTRLAGDPDYSDMMERIIARKFLILEDFNRGAEDTVIGGAHLAVVKPVEGENVDFHLSAYMREEYRRKGLGGFAVGRVLSTALMDYPGTNLFVHGALDPEMKGVLELKGFAAKDDGVLSLKLPGRRIWPREDEDISTLDKEVAEGRLSGIYGNRVYRDGVLVGTIDRKDDEDGILGYSLVIRDASGTMIDTLLCNDIDVDWYLTAAIALLNRHQGRL